MIRVKNIAIFLILITSITALASCSKAGDDQLNTLDIKDGKIVLRMEMDKNYSSSDPFENGLLFCVSEDVETLDAEVFFRMDGESGIVEIKDRNNDDILWSHTWGKDVNINVYPISLSNLKNGKEYVVRFTGTKINRAIVKVTFDSNVVQEKERPSK